jgi:hypothetical protein
MRAQHLRCLPRVRTPTHLDAGTSRPHYRLCAKFGTKRPWVRIPPPRPIDPSHPRQPVFRSVALSDYLSVFLPSVRRGSCGEETAAASAAFRSSGSPSQDGNRAVSCRRSGVRARDAVWCAWRRGHAGQSLQLVCRERHPRNVDRHPQLCRDRVKLPLGFDNSTASLPKHSTHSTATQQCVHHDAFSRGSGGTDRGASPDEQEGRAQRKIGGVR